jgi:hypothetical protein
MRVHHLKQGSNEHPIDQGVLYPTLATKAKWLTASSDCRNKNVDTTLSIHD